MQQILEKLLAIQPNWRDYNGPKFTERYELLKECSQWIDDRKREISSQLEIPTTTLGGSNFSDGFSAGIGNPCEVPWFRFCNPEHSPNARDGWYCVYLFDAEGGHVSLCLARSTTVLASDGSLNPISRGEVINSVDQVRKELAQMEFGELVDDSFAQRLKRSISLHATTNLGKSYEASVVWAITYEAGQIPEEGVLFSDALNFATLLRETYRIVNSGKSTSPPVDKEVSEMHMPFVELGEELFFKPATFFVEVNDLLDDRPQAIFYGPPGTGKTWAALKLAEVIAGDESRTKLVQFHPSYAYEDFIEGWRPTAEGNFKITNGPLKLMAADARDNTNQKFVLVIDEINRANLSKVLGELFFLLEYRDRAITLQYSDEQFKLPKNLIIIGTMNTADRSIALVDAALRRRFHFHGFFPDREPIQGLLKRWLVHKGQTSMLWVADLVDKANSKLNERDLAIGPSHFMKDHLDEEKVQRIWKRSIMPYIEDYFFDDPDQAEEFSYDHLQNEN